MDSFFVFGYTVFIHKEGCIIKIRREVGILCIVLNMKCLN